MTKKKFLERARLLHGYKYEYPNLNDKILLSDHIDIVFNGEIYTQKVNNHINLKRCPEKSTKVKTTDQFIRDARLVWGEKYDYSLTEYKGSSKRIKVIYDGVILEQKASSHLLGKSPERNISNKENFIKKSKKIHGDKYDYSLVDFKSAEDEVIIGYNGKFYKQKPYSHLSGHMPDRKCLSTMKTDEDFILEASFVHDGKFIYDNVRYTGNKKNVTITCPYHGEFYETPSSHLIGNGCRECVEFIGNKKISKFLDRRGLDYTRQYRIESILFDFYIPSIRTVIEFNGKHHYQPLDSLDKYLNIKNSDKSKLEYCNENYINLISIKYDQLPNISKILSDNLLQF